MVDFFSHIEQFRNKRVLVVGDIILDKYIKGIVHRISPEAPVPIVLQESEDVALGGAANVALNARILGAQVSLAGVIGNDPEGEAIEKILRLYGINYFSLLVEQKYSTNVKTRVLAKHQQIVRLDREKPEGITDASRTKLINNLQDVSKFDLILVVDYNKGLLDSHFIEEICSLEYNVGIPIIADPKPNHLEFFKGITAVLPNISEATLGTAGYANSNDLQSIGETIRDTHPGVKCAVITRGEEGIAVFGRQSGIAFWTIIPTVAQTVYDVTGAGDTITATFGLGYVSGLSFNDSAFLANYAAGLTVSRLGCSTVTPEELMGVIDEYEKLENSWAED